VILKRSMWRMVLVLILLSAGPASLASLEAQPPRRPADEGFVPIDQLPPEEKLPAAPLLIAAYSVAWLAVAGYLFSIWRRLARVEREIVEVSRRVQQREVAAAQPRSGEGPAAPQPRSGEGGSR
jgi:CcmD family protein